MMWQDPLVQEIHDIRRQLMLPYHDDLKAYAQHLQDKYRSQGQATVKLDAKKPINVKTDGAPRNP